MGTEFLEGRGERAREAGEAGDGPQIRELAAVEGGGGDTRGQGFADESAVGDERAAIRFGGREFQHEFAKREAAEANERGGAGSEGVFARGGAHGSEHQHGANG